jgi:DNA helicase-2/ATP-dependent DNA helicase PcrA
MSTTSPGTGGPGAARALRWSAADIAAVLGRPSPTPEQTAVIEAPLEPLLVVAGAGSGKTETMAARVVWLIANELVAPDAVLGLTFTRKAAGELAERVRARLAGLRRRGGGAPTSSVFLGPTVSTYHSYAASLVTDHALRLGVEPASRLLTDAGRWQLASDVVEHWAGDLGTELTVGTVTRALLGLADQLAEHLHSPEELRVACAALAARLEALAPARTATQRDAVGKAAASLRLRAALAPLLEELAARKRAGDLMDFADQVALAARLAREVPAVGAGERARFSVVLLDEYQDTSVAQLDLLRHLFGSGPDPEAPLPGTGHPVTAVGDPHQSIYGWRGASAGGLARFPREFRTAGGPAGRRDAAVLVLSTSWRNDRAVLAAANAVAEPLRHGTPLPVPELDARPGAGPGTVETGFEIDEEAEVVAVAWFVAEHRARLARDGVPATAAVLCRKRAQFAAAERALRAAGLPVEVVGLGGLLHEPEVVDLVAALQAAHDPSRGDALMRLLTGPRARLGLGDLAALHDWARETTGRPAVASPGAAPDLVDERSLVDALDRLPRAGWRSHAGRELSDAGRARLAELAGVLRTLRSQTFLPVGDLVAEAEVLLGLDVEVALRPVSPASARAHLDAFRAEATRFDAEEGGTLGAFLGWLEVAEDEEDGLDVPVAELDPEAVQVLTVHAAKGLEWDVVAVPGLTAAVFPVRPRGGSTWPTAHGALPTAMRGDRDSLPDVSFAGAADGTEAAERLAELTAGVREHQLAEERRLAYVALTRARDALLLSGSWWRDGATPHEPSPFLLEVVDALGDPSGPVPESLPDGTAPAQAAPGGAVPAFPTHWVPFAERPERAGDEGVRWPPERPMGERQERLEAAAAAVLAAEPREDWPGDPRGAEVAALAGMLLAERDRRAAASGVPLPEHLSASAVVGLAHDPAAFALALRRPIPLAPSTVARRGTAFHAWVERYFGSAALVDVDALPGADEVVEDAELAVLQRAFLASEWAGRSPVAVEVDVETPVGDVVVRSRIDAVFAEPDGGVVVVDWKTGAVPTGAELAARELQLAVYRIAWSRRTGLPLERVRAAFVYVAHGVTHRPDTLPGPDELARLLAPGDPAGLPPA